ncbi:hypothetical protein H5410_058329 [Solanum commersonii]|uniref:Uncharacterized protein n=1 Tax=Solanum commersonii TaxID=4109 RepID=A0A9J5WQF8_SOLCO|nr:hypothetical protein H5410_058329 [Solanum commersonii]
MKIYCLNLKVSYISLQSSGSIGVVVWCGVLASQEISCADANRINEDVEIDVWAHCERRCANIPAKRCDGLYIARIKRGRDRTKMYSVEVIKQNMAQLKIIEEMTLDRRIRCRNSPMKFHWVYYCYLGSFSSNNMMISSL